jgi:peroxiredoxin
MSRDAKILSVLAGVIMLAAIALIAFISLIGRDEGPLSAETARASVEDSSVAAGKMAPDFHLNDLAGKPVSLSQFRGRVVFLNLWATWCPPCREEMPSIEALHRAFKSDPNFTVLAVSEDAETKPVPNYIKSNKFDFTVLLDPSNSVGEAYGVSGLPESFVIGRDGRIVAHHVGPYDWGNADLRSALQDLIKSKPG